MISYYLIDVLLELRDKLRCNVEALGVVGNLRLFGLAKENDDPHMLRVGVDVDGVLELVLQLSFQYLYDSDGAV